MSAVRETVYETIWRNKFVAMHTKTFDEFIAAIESGVAYLKEMMATGKVELQEQGIGDDYAFFTTTDPVVAAKYGFNEQEHCEDCDCVEYVGEECTDEEDDTDEPIEVMK